MALAQRYIETAKQRGYEIGYILSFDVLPQSPLFEGDYPAEPSKSALVYCSGKYDSSLAPAKLEERLRSKHARCNGLHVQNTSIKKWMYSEHFVIYVIMLYHQR